MKSVCTDKCLPSVYIHAFILYKMQLLYIFISHAMGLNMKIMNPVVCS